jgi:hypothetical protein
VKSGKDGEKGTHNIARRRDLPILVAPFRKSLDDVRLITHQPEQSHYLLPTSPYTTQHVRLLGLLKDEHQLVDTVDFVLDALDQRSECVRNVVDERVRNPVGRDADVVLKLFDSPSYVLWMGGRAEVELQVPLVKPHIREGENHFTERIPSRKTMMYMFSGSRCVGL